MSRKLVKVVEGRMVRNPTSGLLIPQEGLSVQVNSFWLRRVKDGDVTLEDEQPEKATSHSNKKPQSNNKTGGTNDNS